MHELWNLQIEVNGHRTTTYNVYRIYFRQSDKPDHQDIVLVSAQMVDQGRGRCYRVTDDLGLGMDYAHHSFSIRKQCIKNSA